MPGLHVEDAAAPSRASPRQGKAASRGSRRATPCRGGRGGASPGVRARAGQDSSPRHGNATTLARTPEAVSRARDPLGQRRDAPRRPPTGSPCVDERLEVLEHLAAPAEKCARSSPCARRLVSRAQLQRLDREARQDVPAHLDADARARPAPA